MDDSFASIGLGGLATGRRTLRPEHEAGRGLSVDTAAYISDCKGEPPWLRAYRRHAVERCLSSARSAAWTPAPLAELPLESLCYYSAPAGTGADSAAADLLDALGVEREQADYLGAAQAQVDGEVLSRSISEEWSRQGIVFVDSASGLTEFEALFRPHFGSLINADEHLYTALNSAVFSGGSFIYVPPGVKITAPFKCFMHLQASSGVQAGRTLVVMGEDAELTYLESCTSNMPPGPGLHCAVGEFILGRGSKVNYVALQNWGSNVYNLAMLRARLAAGASMQWIDCNIGGRLTMKYPCSLLEGEGAASEAISISLARSGQQHDTGAKMLHRASRTSSTIVSKSISIGEGHAGYRGLVDMPKTWRGCRNHTECDALLVDSVSRTDTYPAITVRGAGNTVQHEASVSRLSEEQIFYMRQRGLPEPHARSLAVNGFVNSLVERFPLQYSLDIKKLIELEMEGSVG